ncbi:Pkinase domain-containing protein/LRR_1 domain-containing protein/LRRNT_2 domain-containing protein/LRR_8 domain-containing protein [Cephalotus follicularis]|uniref:non-specific serine/threonine protein kinase n=1 Tax=Cephalotus follicularis TaxID=3775 RepID=A0A1Q3C5E1_CEPFO|nr:Pkinase domain-containing protein/LRR_1 domain-containing protein/LRRNT_2 domain-containing protein/LRR_8 domain-containing protein [Cephalotus follicularis]
MNSYYRTMNISKTLNALFLLFFQSSLFCSMHFSFSHCGTLGNETDKLALLAFKSQITHDPYGSLKSWNDSLNICQWHGVSCSPRHQRVAAIDLHFHNLAGTISPFIGNLSFLRKINLRNNSFHGEIPQEMGRLFRLRYILFAQNMLQGEIPINLTHCFELRTLDLVLNNLEGTIPAELGTLSKLDGLGLTSNNLTGTIPRSLSNLSSLTQLTLSENSLSGNIPVEFGQLKKLNLFQVSVNRLTGPIPIQLFNISSIEYFAVAENQLVGKIPPYIGFTLPNLQFFFFGGNRFSGPIPQSISNLSQVEWLDFARNSFIGSIPVNLGGLKYLNKLNFAKNNLGTRNGDDLSFLSSLVNCTNLEIISLSFNSLTGELPNSIVNFSSHFSYLFMGSNQISGRIPANIGKLENLLLIGIEDNLLTGIIPLSIGRLSKLQELSLFDNRLSGEIPSSLGNLSFLTEISLGGNALQGSIPSALGSCLHLQILGLSGNNLSGTIPIQVMGLPSLSRWLDLSDNRLTGAVPVEVGNLKTLQWLYLSDNNLSGEIPSSLGSCVSLEELDLGGNSLQGPIPLSLNSLRGLQKLVLSGNNFSGKIPDFLGTLPFLTLLNLSFNNLEGEVPNEGIFKNASAIEVSGNNKLCGGIPELHLQSCQSGSSKVKSAHNRTFKIVIITFCLAIGLLSMCLFAILYWRRGARRETLVESPPAKDMHLKVSYAELLKATDGFSSSNLIGIGGYGSVYKGILGHEETSVAVKVLNVEQRGASNSFIAECEALRCIRHRNLVKIVTACSSVDFKGNDFKAVVYEFMPKGSLEKWLYHQEDEQNRRQSLSLMQRLNIAIDVAHALDYLHHHCHTPIAHCDLKPSNVLLDDDMVAHVGDFGLARLLHDENPQNQTNSSRLKGTVGYVAPEYGMSSEVSAYGDIYSYGILLLEMLTGKRPTDDMFKDGLSLRVFVEMAIPDQVKEVADSTLLDETMDTGDFNGKELSTTSGGKAHEILISILKIGVLSSRESPSERMNIKEVITKLQQLKDIM